MTRNECSRAQSVKFLSRSSVTFKLTMCRALVRLKVLDEAALPSDLNVPGFNFHRLHGRPVRYSVHVSGPWCLTFEWEDADAVRVNLEHYH